MLGVSVKETFGLCFKVVKLKGKEETGRNRRKPDHTKWPCCEGGHGTREGCCLIVKKETGRTHSKTTVTTLLREMTAKNVHKSG